MANIVKDRVLEFTNVTGFDPIQLNGSPIGYRRFGDVLSDGDECYYTLVSENGDWETGISVYDANLNTLDRGTVTDNSVGSNAQIPFQTDSKKVFLTFTAQAYKDLLSSFYNSIVQNIGQSEDKVMSQKAVTNLIPDTSDLLVNSNNLSDVSDVSTARTNLELGTAAIRDITTSNTDTTSGRLITTGYAGIGAVTPGETSLISSPTYGSGFYSNSGTQGDWPTTSMAGIKVSRSATRGWMLSARTTNTDSKSLYFLQTSVNNNWNEQWKQLAFDTPNFTLGKDRSSTDIQSIEMYVVASSGTPNVEMIRNTAANGSFEIRNNGGGHIFYNAGGSTPHRWNYGTRDGQVTGISIVDNYSSDKTFYLDVRHGASTNGQMFNRFVRDGSTIGSITVASASSVSYNTSSDYRLKENIEDIDDPIESVKRLHPISHTWKNDTSGVRYLGFIAHELQEEIPTAVTGEKDAVDDEGNPVYQGADYSKAVPLLTAALQKAIERIEVLEAKLNFKNKQ